MHLHERSCGGSQQVPHIETERITVAVIEASDIIEDLSSVVLHSKEDISVEPGHDIVGVTAATCSICRCTAAFALRACQSTAVRWGMIQIELSEELAICLAAFEPLHIVKSYQDACDVNVDRQRKSSTAIDCCTNAA